MRSSRPPIRPPEANLDSSGAADVTYFTKQEIDEFICNSAFALAVLFMPRWR